MANSRKRLTKQLKSFVCDEIAKGQTLTEVCRKYKDKLPTRDAIAKAQQRDPDFHDAMTRAYDCFITAKMDEMEELSIAEVPESVLQTGDKIRINAWLQNKRARLDILKFTVGKMAGMMSRRFDTATKVEVENKGEPQYNFVIQSFGDKEES